METVYKGLTIYHSIYKEWVLVYIKGWWLLFERVDNDK